MAYSQLPLPFGEQPSWDMPAEYKVVPLRECATPDDLQLCDAPEKAAQYWESHIATAPQFDPEREHFAVLLLNTRLRIKGHQIVSVGTLDLSLAHPREVFRTAIVCAAYGVVLMHNHPSGDPSPSEADVKVTRDLIRAGQLLKIEIADHVIVSHGQHVSLRQLGYFYT